MSGFEKSSVKKSDFIMLLIEIDGRADYGPPRSAKNAERVVTALPASFTKRELIQKTD